MHDADDALALERPTLYRCDGFPAALLDVPATELWRHLRGPTLFHIPGRRPQPLFVCVLLHGNEDTGWRAIQELMRQHRDTPLPRAILLFVGNIAAARANVRTLPGQTDYNRTWPGTPHTAEPEAQLMRQVVEIVRAAEPFASIDIHNNTGHNPNYACVNSLAEPLSTSGAAVQPNASSTSSGRLACNRRPWRTICPAVTVECGRVGGAAGVDPCRRVRGGGAGAVAFPRASRSGRRSRPHADASPSSRCRPRRRLRFDGADADFRFRADLDHLNFSELEPGTVFGRLGAAVRDGSTWWPGRRRADWPAPISPTRTARSG